MRRAITRGTYLKKLLRGSFNTKNAVAFLRAKISSGVNLGATKPVIQESIAPPFIGWR